MSLGEVAETTKKAVLGQGHTLGTAEEMTFAARWLCERGFPGAEAVINALTQFEPVSPSMAQAVSEVRLSGEDGRPLSALVVATSIVELLVALQKPVKLKTLTHAMLLIPFLTRVDARVSAQWRSPDGTPVVIRAIDDAVSIFAPSDSCLRSVLVHDVNCAFGEAKPIAAMLHTPTQLERRRKATIQKGCSVDDTIWRTMQAFAQETYVPISDASRERGAGAGLTDND